MGVGCVMFGILIVKFGFGIGGRGSGVVLIYMIGLYCLKNRFGICLWICIIIFIVMYWNMLNSF